MMLRSIRWKDGTVEFINTRKLPQVLEWRSATKASQMAQSIRGLEIRGAPLIGVAAAYGLALAAYHSSASDADALLVELHAAAEVLRKSRPTAQNLFWALDRVMKRAERAGMRGEDVKEAVVSEANRMADEDVVANQKMGGYGASLIEDGDTVLTICNAGGLATVGYGTALGVIQAAHEQGKRVKVIVPETRPMLQGSRLTAWELKEAGIPALLITDGMVGYVLQKGMVDKVVIGADRILVDGTVFNKIGSYMEAVLAWVHKVPFYVAAPTSTVDFSSKVEDVRVEQRDPIEVLKIGDVQIAPEGVDVLNPAFDIVPAMYVTAIVTEKGVFRQPLRKSLERLRMKS